MKTFEFLKVQQKVEVSTFKNTRKKRKQVHRTF